MCGRYALKTPINVLAERFQLDEYPSSLNASYNIAPPRKWLELWKTGKGSFGCFTGA